ncbi:MAG: hypothetical protein GWP91_06110 [Rhodobacterales bacterium]|nr:hypothetical protein [Rhodobacterales bacterium]
MRADGATGANGLPGADGAQGPAGADGVGDTYDGTPFALSNQTCNAGDVIAGIAADGAARCESDANDMYGAGWLDDDKPLLHFGQRRESQIQHRRSSRRKRGRPPRRWRTSS